jgi:hypothetical protein
VRTCNMEMKSSASSVMNFVKYLSEVSSNE